MPAFSVISQDPTIRALVQDGMLERAFHDALFPALLFRADCEPILYPGNVGDSRIFTGKAGGSTGLLKILVGNFLGVRTEKIIYDIKGDTRIFQIPKIIEGVVKPIAGKVKGEPVTVSNTGYWIGKDVTIARAETSRVRAFGRNWNFEGRSAELVRLDWGSDVR